jgi:hypothetical protein
VRRIGVIAVIFAIAVGLVACSSDDDESGELSTSEFATQANKICENITKQVDDALKNVNPGTPQGAASAQAIGEVATLDKKQIGHVDDLAAPESEQDEIDQLLDQWRDRSSQEQQIADAVSESGDTATIEALNDQLNQIEDKANAIATKLGLDRCTRGGT